MAPRRCRGPQAHAAPPFGLLASSLALLTLAPAPVGAVTYGIPAMSCPLGGYLSIPTRKCITQVQGNVTTYPLALAAHCPALLPSGTPLTFAHSADALAFRYAMYNATIRKCAYAFAGMYRDAMSSDLPLWHTTSRSVAYKHSTVSGGDGLVTPTGSAGSWGQATTSLWRF